MDKRFEAVDKRFEAMDRRFETMDKRFEALHADIKRTALEVATLSGRSGTDLEEMVRSLMQDVLARHRVDLTDIKKVQLVDVDGTVFSPGYATDIDVDARDGEIHLYEIKYRADQRDAYHFMQVARLYEHVHGIKASRLVLLVLEIRSATLRAISTFPVPIDVIAGSVVP
ncbi:MAG: DUF3782 domain-containing protein [Candidatus Sigynarchaeota archaeon]